MNVVIYARFSSHSQTEQSIEGQLKVCYEFATADNYTVAIEENKRINLTEPQIRAFLDYVREMPDDDITKRRALINIFVHSIYLYDDHFTMIINASKKPLHIDNIPLEDIEAAFEGENGAKEECSSMNTPVLS